MHTTTTAVDIPTADGIADAYLVKPDGAGPFPGVLMFMDAYGLRPRLIAMAERIAERGYAVLMPNLFYRSSRSPILTPEEMADGSVFGQKLMPMIRTLTPAKVVEDAGAYLGFLAAQDDVATGPRVITGYCMGGRNALRVIEAYPGSFAALGSFHAGTVVTDQPDSPHLGVGSITGEVYFAHADHDRSMTPEEIATLEGALAAAGVRYTSEVYPDAPHGFTMSDTAAYQEAGEQRHWTNLFALLDRALPVPVS
ncbi:dienelactone hydrolase family protein [Actinoplanes sp. TBRC 11911]|uniref:dienelactone hydrolase family protein n=1 Tax=Actinoplanes sp. TBRC 11911 TaxID=2729386 RepID=UPI00145F1A3C|nr:dienelactone hydrolase family protein [Actinoplanes sp. TBRC 11911]NMO53827.1 dienelactone hydrolase family protein [Actinoplanes sp. TBRC 11911]